MRPDGSATLPSNVLKNIMLDDLLDKQRVIGYESLLDTVDVLMNHLNGQIDILRKKSQLMQIANDRLQSRVVSFEDIISKKSILIDQYDKRVVRLEGEVDKLKVQNAILKPIAIGGGGVLLVWVLTLIL